MKFKNALREFVYIDGAMLTTYDLETPQTFTVDITTLSGIPVSGALVRAYTETGVDTGVTATSDTQGEATFSQGDFSEGFYQFRITHADVETWSPLVYVKYSNILEAQLELEPITIQFTKLGAGKPGAVVSVYSDTGEYLGLEATTDDKGKVTFLLPTARTYTFLVAYEGESLWSDLVTIGPAPPPWFSEIFRFSPPSFDT